MSTFPKDAGPDSFSFLSALEDRRPGSATTRPSFVMRAGSVASMMTIRSGDWKLITGLGSGGFSRPKNLTPGPADPQGQLYNLAKDLAETENLYSRHPEVVARLTSEMNRIVESGHSRPLP